MHDPLERLAVEDDHHFEWRATQPMCTWCGLRGRHSPVCQAVAITSPPWTAWWRRRR